MILRIKFALAVLACLGLTVAGAVHKPEAVCEVRHG